MRVSGSGTAHNGRAAIKRRRELHHADIAISILHDALLAVAKGDITPEKVRDFFWLGEALGRAEYFGDAIEFTEGPSSEGSASTEREQWQQEK